MIKKIIACAITALCMQSSWAGNVYLGPALFLQDNTTPTSNYRGLQPRLTAGYADSLQDLFLAGEIFVDPTSAIISNNYSSPGAVSARSTWSYGAGILPGTLITEHVLGFARIGVLTTKFTGPSTSRWGAEFGLGLQTCLTPYWDLRAEYIYTAYKTVPHLGAVKADQVGIGLIYKVIG